MAGARPALDVVVPAHNEAGLIATCLSAVLAERDAVDLRVVVVANGADDGTAAAARAAGACVVLELGRADKARAVAAGLARCRAGAVAIVDADTVLLPGAVTRMARTLDSDRAVLASPRPVVVTSPSRLVRSFFRIWSRLPAVAGDVIGSGCYGVSRGGRPRLAGLPPVVADDGWVRSQFARRERILLSDAGFLVVPPGRAELPAVQRRWRRGNRELGEADPSASRGRNLRWLAARPGLWRNLPAFAWVRVAAGRAPVSGGAWARSAEARAVPADLPVRPAVHAVVITYNSAAVIERCLASLTSRSADLVVTVVDNASADGSEAVVRRSGRADAVISNPANAGFGRAVNQVADRVPSDFVLLVNPDVVLDAGAVDELVAVARRVPGAGIVGGRARTPEGGLDPSACVALPSLGADLRFATGLSAAGRIPLLDADALGGWKRDDVREVPALTGSLLLVRTDLWRRLHGFDERFFLYGEDVDLCARARRLGARPTFTPRAGYVHLGGHASPSAADRMQGILGGRAILARTHLGWRGPAAVRCLIAGVGVRALGERLLRAGRAPVWQAAWRARADWGA